MKYRIITLMLLVIVALVGCENSKSSMDYTIINTEIKLEAIDYHEVSIKKVEGDWLYYAQNKKNTLGEKKDYSLFNKVNYKTGEIVELFNIKGYVIWNYIRVDEHYFATVCDFTGLSGFDKFDCDVMYLNEQKLFGLNELDEYEDFYDFKVKNDTFSFSKETAEKTYQYAVSLDDLEVEELSSTDRVSHVERKSEYYKTNDTGEYETVYYMDSGTFHFYGGRYHIESSFMEYTVYYDEEVVHSSNRDLVGALYDNGRLIISDMRVGLDVKTCQNFAIENDGSKSKFKSKFCLTNPKLISNGFHLVNEFKTYSTAAEANQTPDSFLLRIEDDLVLENFAIENFASHHPIFSLDDGNFLAINEDFELFLVEFE
jgi:hypothetical protein